MKTSQTGINLIKQFEGCRLAAYKCAAGVLTIGYGHTAGVKPGQTITQAQADVFFKADCVKIEDKVNKYHKSYTWNQNEFDALVSFAFNLGSIDQLTANGTRSRKVIAEKILLYNKAGGKVSNGLIKRREAERKLFLTKVDNNPNNTIPNATGENTAFKIKVTASCLNIRSAPDAASARTGRIRDKGVYTIVETIKNWGRLKSGAGWIHLDYTKRI